MKSNGKAAAHSFNVMVDEACANIDYKYGPYLSKQDAFNTLGEDGLDVLAIGLTVGIITDDGVVEYWFKKACSSVDDLVEKFPTSGYVVDGDSADSTSAIDSDKEVQDFLEGIDNTKKLKDMLSGTVDEDGIVHY